MNKPRVQSPLDRLPLHQKQTLRAWLTTGGEYGAGLTYRAAAHRLLSEFGVKASGTALSRFYLRHHKAEAVPAGAGVAVVPKGDGLTITINVSRAIFPVSNPKPKTNPT
jgi:hypothetical protein